MFLVLVKWFHWLYRRVWRVHCVRLSMSFNRPLPPTCSVWFSRFRVQTPLLTSHHLLSKKLVINGWLSFNPNTNLSFLVFSFIFSVQGSRIVCVWALWWHWLWQLVSVSAGEGASDQGSKVVCLATRHILLINLSSTHFRYKIIRHRVTWILGTWVTVKMSPHLRPSLYSLLVPLLTRNEDLAVRFHSHFSFRCTF